MIPAFTTAAALPARHRLALPRGHTTALPPPPAPPTPARRRRQTPTAVLSPTHPVSHTPSSDDRAPPSATADAEGDEASNGQHLTPTTRNPDWLFYDVARVLVEGGAGGNGALAFRREKGVPRGGPAGGSGGRGGTVVFEACATGGNTLSRFRGSPAFRARPGANGTGKARHGAAAADSVVAVPVGTVVRNDAGRVLADLSAPGARFVAARGGRGGRGNVAFKTERNRAPRLCERGEPGQSRRLRLELKLVADVGLVGCPNAGKSSLLDAVSNARPKIAAYAFTTVVPNLGVVDRVDGANGLVMADVPGLIDGAHRGVGMGQAFLRHVERCRVVVHVVDGGAEDAVERYKAIRMELALFGQRLARKTEVVLVNKADLPAASAAWEGGGLAERLAEAAGHRRIAFVSAKSGAGLHRAVQRLSALVDATEDDGVDVVVLGETDDDEGAAAVTKDADGALRVEGHKVEQAFSMTNWDYVEAIDRFQRILAALGVNDRLKKAGAQDGDLIRCFDREFEYYAEENVYSAAAALDGYID